MRLASSAPRCGDAERRRPRSCSCRGNSQEAVFQNESVEVATAFLPKPFTIRQLTTQVREVLAAPAGEQP